MSSNEVTEGDTFIILSSELIASVMEQHFNEVMFKQEVKIVDLKVTEVGYMFGLIFTDIVANNAESNNNNTAIFVKEADPLDKALVQMHSSSRNGKGQYSKDKNKVAVNHE